MMKGALLTEKTSHFLLFWFYAGQDVQMVFGKKKKKDRQKKRTDDTEVQKRLTGSLACTPGVWLKDSCFLKLWVARDDRLITQWKVSYAFAVWTYLAAFHCIGSSGCEGSWESATLMFCWSFLWNILDMRHIRYKFKASGLNSQLVLMIFCTASGDMLSRLFNVLIAYNQDYLTRNNRSVVKRCRTWSHTKLDRY